MLQKALNSFWGWYERNYTLNVGIALVLFVFQLVHLYWLSFEVVFMRLFGESWVQFEGIFQTLIVLVDYTEIPALLSVSLIYIDKLRKGWDTKSVLFLILLNSQWLHLFWITDEYVVDQFAGASDGHSYGGTILPAWLAWVAIFIDYLELPVMVDTGITFIKSFLKGEKVDVTKLK